METIVEKINNEYDYFDNVFYEEGIIYVEEYYEMSEDEKNSDDCCDLAKENGKMIENKFPELEMVQYLCHRNKYAITELKLKNYEK